MILNFGKSNVSQFSVLTNVPSHRVRMYSCSDDPQVNYIYFTQFSVWLFVHSISFVVQRQTTRVPPTNSRSGRNLRCSTLPGIRYPGGQLSELYWWHGKYAHDEWWILNHTLFPCANAVSSHAPRSVSQAVLNIELDIVLNFTTEMRYYRKSSEWILLRLLDREFGIDPCFPESCLVHIDMLKTDGTLPAPRRKLDGSEGPVYYIWWAFI